MTQANADRIGRKVLPGSTIPDSDVHAVMAMISGLRHALAQSAPALKHSEAVELVRRQVASVEAPAD